MISANGGLPAHRYTPQVTPRWPRGSEPASAEGAQRGPVLVGTFFMVAEAYLLPLPTADPGTWAPMSPAQVRPGCALWTRWRPRQRLEP